MRLGQEESEDKASLG